MDLSLLLSHLVYVTHNNSNIHHTTINRKIYFLEYGRTFCVVVLFSLCAIFCYLMLLLFGLCSIDLHSYCSQCLVLHYFIRMYE